MKFLIVLAAVACVASAAVIHTTPVAAALVRTPVEPYAYTTENHAYAPVAPVVQHVSYASAPAVHTYTPAAAYSAPVAPVTTYAAPAASAVAYTPFSYNGYSAPYAFGQQFPQFQPFF